VLLVLLQDIVPGKSWYHSGAYAWALILLTAALVWRTRAARRNRECAAGIAVASAGAAVVAIAGLAATLLGPDTHTIIRAPAERIPISEPPGVIAFPSLDAFGAAIEFTPQGRSAFRVRARRYFGAYIFTSMSRDVAILKAATAADAHLTITQPDNSSFLSPVLLFSGQSEIAGRTLPVDSFAVPALRRSIKAVLFSARAIAQMDPEVSRDPRPGVLFAVNDERGRLIPGAIRLVRSGARATIGGLTLEVGVASYPAVTIAAAPYWPLLLLGLLLYALGLALALRRLKIRHA